MVQFIELTKKDGGKFPLEIHKIISIEDNMIKNSGVDRETSDGTELWCDHNYFRLVRESVQEIIDKIARVQLENERLVIQPDGKIEKIRISND